MINLNHAIKKLNLKTAQNIWRDISPAPSAHAPSAPKLANEIADTFMADFFAGQPPDFSQINLLCQMAASPTIMAKAAVAALYGIVIEGLSDDFSPRGVDVGNAVLIHIMAYLRRNGLIDEIDRQLDKLGYQQTIELLARYQRISNHETLAHRASIKKVFILSRVTIGADVAITGIIAWRLRQTLVNAEIILVGPPHLKQIFHHLPGSDFITITGKRRGSLVERFSFWPALYKSINNEIMGLSPNEILLFDPDSRLSQLGLLPLIAEESTFFFNSRAMRPIADDRSLSALINQWLDGLLGEKRPCFPQVSFANKQIEICNLFCRHLRAKGCRRIIAINFGVGEDKRKRIPAPFEEKVIIALLQHPGTILLLDSGSGSEEKGRVAELLNTETIKDIDQQKLTGDDFAGDKINLSHGIINLQDSVGGFGAMLNEADLYLGYDSCFQHLANATTTPALIVFCGHPNERFIARWSPENLTASTRIIAVADNKSLSTPDICALAEKVSRAMDNLLA